MYYYFSAYINLTLTAYFKVYLHDQNAETWKRKNRITNWRISYNSRWKARIAGALMQNETEKNGKKCMKQNRKVNDWEGDPAEDTMMKWKKIWEFREWNGERELAQERVEVSCVAGHRSLKGCSAMKEKED